MLCIQISSIKKAVFLAIASITQPSKLMSSHAKIAIMESSATLEPAPLRAMSPCVDIIHLSRLLINAQELFNSLSVLLAQLRRPNSVLLDQYVVNQFILILMVPTPHTMAASTQQPAHSIQ